MSIDRAIVAEASRCIGCKNARCMAHCPLGNNIPSIMSAVARGEGNLAYSILSATNRLGAICGTVCPHRHLCEGHCVLGDNHIDIGTVEQYISLHYASVAVRDNSLAGHNIAVVGGGVSGIACSLELCSHGAHVDIYDGNIIGGVVSRGIPHFRLPRQYVDSVLKLVDNSDISVVQSYVGRDISLMQLDSMYSAVYLAVGFGVDNKLNITGEDKCGVVYGNSYLAQPYSLGNVVVIGGGNVAVDCARTAVRLGDSVTIAYRRTIAQMPAYDTEIAHAQAEGVAILELLSPHHIVGADSVSGIECTNMQLGAIGSDGRATVEATDSTTLLQCDSIIVATGSSMANQILHNTGIEYNRHGVVVDSNMHTGVGNIYAGGDIVNSHSTVVHAVLDGTTTAGHILDMLTR